MADISRTEKDQPYKEEKKILSLLQLGKQRENYTHNNSITWTAGKKLNDHLNYSFIRLFGFWIPPVP